MKTFKILFVLAVCFSATSVTAQSLIGDWKFEVPMPDGSLMPATASISEEGTFSYDFGMDGVVETTGSYRVEGNELILSNRRGAMGGCPEDSEAIYSFEIKGEQIVLTLIEDDCPGGVEEIVGTKM